MGENGSKDRALCYGSLSQNIGKRTEGWGGWGRNARAGALSLLTSVGLMSRLVSSRD